MNMTLVSAACLALSASAAAGCGGGSAALGPSLPIASPSATPLPVNLDDWTMYAHDQARTGFESQALAITAATVPSLRVRWKASLGETIFSSPIVASGSVYVATDAGTVAALDAVTGALKWRMNAGGPVHMTPMLAGTSLYVGVYGSNATVPPSGAAFLALDARTGAVLWRTALPGLVRADPVIAGNVLFEGIAGGDPNTGCVSGRIIALDPAGGAVLPNAWFTSSTPNNGGGIWSPLSTDGRRLFFTTGNTCDGSGSQDAVVATSLDFTASFWITPVTMPSGRDIDVGSGAMLLGSTAYAAGKSGTIVALDVNTGAIRWSHYLGSISGLGPIGTPTSDGNVVVTQTGTLITIPASAGRRPKDAQVGNLVAFDLNGNLKWTIPSQVPGSGYVAFAPGVAFTTVYNQVVALDPATGRTLWTFSGPSNSYASPVIVPSGLYTADLAGNVYAFGL